jgi:hypothetical protein
VMASHQTHDVGELWAVIDVEIGAICRAGPPRASLRSSPDRSRKTTADSAGSASGCGLSARNRRPSRADSGATP